jgi:pimeloyl-ACP methyl ester carboxylesterase
LTQSYSNEFWTSEDGLRLHYRDYAGPADRPALLCLPGLTRNCRDFEALAQAFAGQWRVICPDLRGRGESEYAREASVYNPAVYIKDIESLFEQAALDRVVIIGTSLGGLLTMLMAPAHGQRIAGAVLNDIGPRLERAGLERVRETVSRAATFPTWMHAARALQSTYGASFPDYSITDWLDHAKRRMNVSGNGRIGFAYDMKIAHASQDAVIAEDVDIWTDFEALAGRPLLAVRGELSDLLSASTLGEMKARIPAMEVLTIRRAGHAPSLAEPEAVAAIARLLGKVA